MHEVMSGNFLLRCSESLCTLVNKCKWFGEHMVVPMDSFSLLLKSQEWWQGYACSSVLQKICSWKEAWKMYEEIKRAYFRKVIENMEDCALWKNSSLKTKLLHLQHIQILLEIAWLQQFCLFSLAVDLSLFLSKNIHVHFWWVILSLKKKKKRHNLQWYTCKTGSERTVTNIPCLTG